MLIERGARVIALDRDPAAVRAGRALQASSGGRLQLVEAHFSELDEAAMRLGAREADGVVFDIGVSSMQLDDPSRGFSFKHEGPLDMRMNPRRGQPASALLQRSKRIRGDDDTRG